MLVLSYGKLVNSLSRSFYPRGTCRIDAIKEAFIKLYLSTHSELDRKSVLSRGVKLSKNLQIIVVTVGSLTNLAQIVYPVM